MGAALVNTPPGQALGRSLAGHWPQGLSWHDLEIVLLMSAGPLHLPLHLSELWSGRQDVGPKTVLSLVPVSGEGTAQPQTSFYTRLVKPVSATILGKAQASSAYLFKASFCQLFGALKGHISTPGDASAQPILSQLIPGCSPPPTSSSPGCFHS